MPRDTLDVFGVRYTDVAGIKATDSTSTVQRYVRPEGTLDITQNGTNIDVAAYEKVNVNVQSGFDPDIWQDQEGFVHFGTEGGGPTPPPTPTPWVRPSDWPDLSQMDVSAGDILYMTSYADEARGFCDFYINCTGDYTVEVGSISGDTFTAESTNTYSSGSECFLYYGSSNGTYKVLKVTGVDIQSLYFYAGNRTIIENKIINTSKQGVIDIIGKLPSCTRLYFYSIHNVTNIDISDVVLGPLYGSSSFNNCRNLVSINTSTWDVSSATTMNSMFNNCYLLTSLDVSDWDVSAVTNMSSMFYGCYSLVSLDVSDWDVSAVTSMNSMFSNCYLLTSLDVSDWDVSAVTTMSSMFTNCYALISLDVSDWNVSAVTNMNSVFSSCILLPSLDVSNWDVSVVTSMNSMFSNCYSLTSLNVSDWDVNAVTTMSSMFSSCYSLTSLDVSKWDVSNVTNMSNTFSNCYALISLDVSDWDVSAVTSMNSMFYNCCSLTSLDVSDWDVSAVTTMSYMLYKCYLLDKINVSDWDVSAAKNMSYMFFNCYSLTSLDVSDWDVSAVTNINSIFYGCFSLMSLDISDWNVSGVTSTSNSNDAFRGCHGLYYSLILPSTFNYIGTYCFAEELYIYEWHFKSTTPPTLANINAFGDTMTDYGGKKIYVPYSADHSILNAYKGATNWSSLAQYIVEEPAP